MPISSTLTPQQETLRRKLKDELGKILSRRADNPMSKYAHQVATSGDWTVEQLPSMTLPPEMRDMITVSQRDAGNALIEETRLLNNQYAGYKFRTVEAILANDDELLDLRNRALDWAVEVAGQLCFKLRHRARSEPFRAFFIAYDGFVAPLDTKIAHGTDRLYSKVWAPVVDLLPYQIFDTLLLKPGYCKISFGAPPAHLPVIFLPSDLPASAQKRVETVLSLYAVEPVAYLDNVVLAPLLAALRNASGMPDLAEMEATYRSMFGDLLEAHPYLMLSERAERYVFEIPGTSCVGTFTFIAPQGCATIFFADDVENLLSGVRTNFVRGALNIGYDGKIFWHMHPWRKLEALFEAEGAITLSWWLIKQVHSQLVQDFLSIEHYYLHGTDEQVDAPRTDDAPDEALLYVTMAKSSDAANNASDDECEAVEILDGNWASSVLPQLRRRYFFKLLERCGVEVAQGKGSEIKLLRKSKRPFRLGNHYGSNPTIPAFLAASILKRLDITRQDWIDAIALG